jgi:hypothetical protein
MTINLQFLSADLSRFSPKAAMTPAISGVCCFAGMILTAECTNGRCHNQCSLATALMFAASYSIEA